MARFYDRLMRSDLNDFGVGMFSNRIVVDVTNISEYLSSLDAKSIMNLIDVNMCIPPFDRTFVEYRYRFKDIRGSASVGICVDHFRVDENDLDQREVFKKFFHGEPLPDGTEHIAACAVVLNSFNKFSNASIFYIPINEVGQWSGDIAQHPSSELMEDIQRQALITILTAFTFMHTRNTVMIDNPPPAKLSKRHEKKYGVPLVTYKTLKVLPMRKVNQNDYDADDTENVSIPKSLHIARGHFKDYRNGPGLFGKFQDIFWWDAHVRGSAEQGVVVKDYDVQAPEPVS